MKWKKRQGGMAENNFTKLSDRFRKFMAKCFGVDKVVNLRTPSKLFVNGKLESFPHVVAETMNEIYISKIKNIQKNLPASNGDPLKYLKLMMENKNVAFSFSPVHPDLVEDIVSKLKSSKSCGLDNIDTYILKIIKPLIVPAITHIVNLSILTSRFPTAWKYS